MGGRNVSMTLKQDLGNSRSVVEMTEALTQVATKSELARIYKEMAIRHHINFSRKVFQKVDTNLEKLDKKWSRIRNSRVRMLLALHYPQENYLELTLSLLSELPINIIIGWVPALRTLSYDPEATAAKLYSDNSELSENIIILWRALQSFVVIPNPVAQNKTTTEILLQRFLSDNERTTRSKLELCFAIEALYPNATHHFPNYIKVLKGGLICSFKKEEGLNDVPDSWIKELLPSNLTQIALAFDIVFIP
jgi:hypothetical protein